MTQHLVIVGARVLFVISAALGLVWWPLLAQRGAFARMPPQASPFLVGFLVMQVLVWGLVAGVLWSGDRISSRGLHVGVVVLALLLVLGNALFYFTPVVGAPMLAIAGLVAVPLLFLSRRHHRA